ncbi:MAG TPA: P-type DNA transfer protein VirB5 [Anaeromyxobacter sp.]|nr:P-type DNA transfer protein VirB5 [Anaeromyxobacter sp.]
MRRKALGALLLALAAEGARANYPVFDASNFAKMVETVALLQREVLELQAAYRAVTGSRNLGAVLYNPALRAYLPSDWGKVYDAASSGAYAGISGTLREVERAEHLAGTVAEQLEGVEERRRAAARTDKAVGLRAFEGAKARLSQIEGLMEQANLTRDAKGIAEIQARIGVEQAAVQNEATKLQLVALLQRAEERLEAEQRRDLAGRILDPANPRMPECCTWR